MSQPPDPAPSADVVSVTERVGTPGSPASGDSLSRVLADLQAVEDLPLEERAAVFERMHDVITDALSRTVDRENAAGASSPVATGGGTR